jgi:hypothetical protein
MRGVIVAVVILLAGCGQAAPKSEQERACRLPGDEFTTYVADNIALGSDRVAFVARLRAVCPEKVAYALG